MPKIPTRQIQTGSLNVGRPTLQNSKAAGAEIEALGQVAKQAFDTVLAITEKNEKKAAKSYARAYALNYQRELAQIENETRNEYSETDYKGFADNFTQKAIELEKSYLEKAPNEVGQEAFLGAINNTKSRAFLKADAVEVSKNKTYHSNKVQESFVATLDSIRDTGDLKQAEMAYGMIKEDILESDVFSEEEKKVLVKKYQASTLDAIIDGYATSAELAKPDNVPDIYDELIEQVTGNSPLIKELTKDLGPAGVDNLRDKLEQKKISAINAAQLQDAREQRQRDRIEQAYQQKNYESFNSQIAELERLREKGEEIDADEIKALSIDIRKAEEKGALNVNSGKGRTLLNRIKGVSKEVSNANYAKFEDLINSGQPLDYIREFMDESVLTPRHAKTMEETFKSLSSPGSTSELEGSLKYDASRQEFVKFNLLFKDESPETKEKLIERRNEIIKSGKGGMMGEMANKIVLSEQDLPDVSHFKGMYVNFKQGEPVSRELLDNYHDFLKSRISKDGAQKGTITAQEAEQRYYQVERYINIMEARDYLKTSKGN